VIAIIDYGAGNLSSVKKACEYIGCTAKITSDRATVLSSGRIILPGVGAFGDAMDGLKQNGMDDVVREAVQRSLPMLGICLGLQLLFDESEEFGRHEGLKLIPGKVKAFDRAMGLKIPHMGWNAVAMQKSHPVFDGIDPEDRFYFVHSFYPAPADPATVIATTDYGVTFASVIGFANLVATQFHPEKSGRAGLHILENFCRWIPC